VPPLILSLPSVGNPIMAKEAHLEENARLFLD
jgi:hypothetical protein